MTDSTSLAGGAARPQPNIPVISVGLSVAVTSWLAATGNWGLAVVLVTFLIGAIAAARQWAPAPLVALALIALIPYPLWSALTGGTDGDLLSRVHPATVYVGVLLGLGWRPPLTWQVLLSERRTRVALTLQAIFLLLAAGMSVAERGIRGLSLLLDNYVGPFLLFWFLVSGVCRAPSWRARAGKLIVLSGVVLGLLGLTEGLFGENPLFESIYGDVPWFPFATGQYRSTITFGAPLAASNGLLFALAISPVIESLWSRIASATVLVLGILATGSRSASAIAFALYPVAMVAWGERHQLNVRVRQSRTIALGLGAACVLAMAVLSPFGQRVLQRTTTAWESTAVRFVGAAYFAENVRSYETKGVGLGGSTDVSTAVFGSYITFENPWIMLAVDLGIPLVLLYAATLLASSRVATADEPIAWAILIGVVGLIAFESTYNSFGVRSIAAYLLWASLAFLRGSSSSYRSATAL